MKMPAASEGGNLGRDRAREDGRVRETAGGTSRHVPNVILTIMSGGGNGRAAGTLHGRVVAAMLRK